MNSSECYKEAHRQLEKLTIRTNRTIRVLGDILEPADLDYVKQQLLLRLRVVKEEVERTIKRHQEEGETYACSNT